MSDSVLVALISFAGSLLVALLSYRASHNAVKEASAENIKLIAFRLEELEKKVDKHNQVVERTFTLEGRMNEAEHDIRDLKGAKA